MSENRKYVAELLLKVQSERAISEARKDLKGLLDTAANAEQTLAKTLESLRNKYNIDVGINLEAEDIQAELARVTGAIQTGGVGLGIGFQEASGDAAQLAQAVNAVTAAQQAALKGTQNLGQATEQLASASKEYERASVQASGRAAQSHIKTNLAAQNVVRVVQDLPYGMLGITNNLQSLADSMVYLRQNMVYLNTETGKVKLELEAGEEATGKWERTNLSWGKAVTSTLKTLLTGPFAFSLVIAVVTSLLLKWDQLSNTFDKARVALGLLSEEQAAFNRLAREFEALQDRKPYERWTEAVSGITLDSAYKTRLNITRELIEREAELAEATEGSTDEMARAYRLRHTLITQAAAAQAGALLPPGAGTSHSSRVSNVEQLTMAEARLADQYEANKNRVENLTATVEELRVMRQAVINEQTRLSQKATDNSILAAFGFKTDSETEDKVKKGLAHLYFEIRQFQIDAMADSNEKVIAQVALDFDRERAAWQSGQAGLADALRESMAAQTRAEEEALKERAEKQREIRIEQIESIQRIRELRIQIEEQNGQARVAQIADEHARERASLALTLETEGDALEAQREALEAKLELMDREEDGYAEMEAQIELIEAERVRIRIETENEIRESHRREAESIVALNDKRLEIYQELQAERKRLNSSGGGIFGEIDQRRSDREADSFRKLQETMQAIKDAYKGDEEGAQDAEAEALQQHQDRMANIEKDSLNERRQAQVEHWKNVVSVATQALSGIVGSLSQAAQLNYETWRETRDNELEAMGTTAEEREAIIEKEGKAMFEKQKKLRIAEAWINGLGGAVAAVSGAMSLGPIAGPIVGGVQAAAIMALTAANVRQIKNTRPGGGGGGGGGSSGGFSAGSFTSLNGTIASDRVAGFETFRLAGGFANDPFGGAAGRIENAASRMEESARNLTAEVTPRAQGQIFRNGRQFNSMTNGNA